MPAKSPFGRIFITPGAHEALSEASIRRALARHLSDIWDGVCAQSATADERALVERARLMSVCYDDNKMKFLTITEADRSATTILLPSEY